MNHIYLIIIIVLVLCNILSGLIGFILGKLWSISGVTNNKPRAFLKDAIEVTNTVSIDDKVYVTDIKTDGMIKKYDDLGEVKKSDENITSSVNKLKQMKG